MRVRNYFEIASRRAGGMLYGAWQPHYLDGFTPAQELADRALTLAMVDIDGDIVLEAGDGAKARQIIAEVGWGDAVQYRNDVPGRLATFARIAEERGW